MTCTALVMMLVTTVGHWGCLDRYSAPRRRSENTHLYGKTNTCSNKGTVEPKGHLFATVALPEGQIMKRAIDGVCVLLCIVSSDALTIPNFPKVSYSLGRCMGGFYNCAPKILAFLIASLTSPPRIPAVPLSFMS